MATLGLQKRADDLKAKLKIKSSGSSGSATLPSVSRAKLFQQIGKPGERFEEITDRSTFLDPKNPSEIARQSDTRYADLGHIGGEFAQTPSAVDNIVRTDRYGPDEPTGAQKKGWRGGVDSLSGEVDHIIPLWLGGSNKPQNLRVIPHEQHINVVTRVQKAIEYLYRNPALAEKYFGRKLSLAEARNYAVNAPSVHKDAFKGLKFDPKWGDVKGKNLDDRVKKSAQILSRFTQDPEDVGIFDVLKSRNLREAGETLGERLGEKMPDTFGGEMVKGLVSGLTLGHITYAEENADASAKAQLGGMVGNIVGGLASMLLGGVAIKAGLKAAGAASGVAQAGATGAKLSKGARFLDAVKRINPNIAKGVEKFIAPKAKAIDLKSKKGILSKVFKGKAAKAVDEAGGLRDSIGVLEAFKPSFKQGFKKRFLEDAAIFGTIGQLSKQDDQELSTRAKRLATDLAFGGLTASVPGGLSKKLATVWVGAGLIDTVAGASPSEAATNATIMTLFHGIGGFRNSGLSAKAIDNYAAEVSAKTRNKWLKDPGRDAITVNGSYADDADLETNLKKLRDTLNAEVDEIIKAIDEDTSMTNMQKLKEKQAVWLSAKQTETLAMPESMRGQADFENMQEMAKRLRKEEDAISELHKKGDAYSNASSNFEPIPTDSLASVVFTTKGVSGNLSKSSADDVAKAFINENFNIEGDTLVPKGNSQAFIVKLPELEAKSIEKPNPATFGDTPTVHSQNVYELQLRDHTGKIYHYGVVDESVDPKLFGKLRKDGIEVVEANLDNIRITDKGVDVQASVSEPALARVDEFNAHVNGELEGLKTQKKVTTREPVKAEESTPVAESVKAEEPTPVAEPVKAEEPSIKAEAPTSRSSEVKKYIADKQSTPDELMEHSTPINEAGNFYYPDEQIVKPSKTRAETKAKFKEVDVDRAIREQVPFGTAPRGVEIAMGDKKLLRSIETTALALQQEKITRKMRNNLNAQFKRFKDELINERELDLGELEKLSRKVLKARYTTEKGIDPTINKLAKDKVAAGMDRDQALKESVEDMIAHEIMGKPVAKVKETPTESQLDIAKKARKLENQRMKEVESVEGASGTELESFEVMPDAPKTAPVNTPFTETPSRIKARAEGKLVEIRDKKPVDLEPKGKVKLEKDQTGATEIQAKKMSDARRDIRNAIKSSDRPKNETVKEYKERMIEVIEKDVMSTHRGQSVSRSGRIDVKKEAAGLKKFEDPYMTGKPSGAYAGSGEVLNRQQLDELDQIIEMELNMKSEQIKIDEPSIESPAKADAKAKFYNPEFVNKLIDGGDVEEVAIYNKLIKALEEGKIDGENNEFYAALEAYRKNDQSIIMKNNVLRYLKEFSDVADDADDAFDLAVASKKISGSEVNRDQFVTAMVDIENADLSTIPDHIIKLDPIKKKIIELDPTVEDSIESLMRGDPARNVPSLSSNEATVKALKEAKNRDKLDIEIMNKGKEEFEAEVKSGKVRDIGDNKEKYLKAYFFADDTGVRADIARLDSLKKRLKKDATREGVGSTSSLSILEKAAETKDVGFEPIYGISKQTIAKANKRYELDDLSNDPIFSYETAKGETRPVNNPVSVVIRESSRTAKDKLEKDLWSVVDEELGRLGKLKKSQGEIDFREWDTNLKGDDIAMIFDSSRKGNSGMNRLVRLTDTQKATYSIVNNSDFINIDVSKYPNKEIADKLRRIQDIVIQRIDENNKIIAESGLTEKQLRDRRVNSKNWIKVWTKAEEAPKPFEINVTDIALAVDRMDTPIGKEMMRLARNADEERAVIDYLGTGLDSHLTKYPHLEKFAVTADMADMHRVSLEHAKAKETGEIGPGEKDLSSQDYKMLDEMEESPGFDETFGDITDENYIPRKEYAVADIQINSTSDPFIRKYLMDLPDKERQEAMSKNAKLIASQILESTEDAMRTSKYMKGKRFEGILQKSNELSEAKAEKADMLTKLDQGEASSSIDDEIFNVKKRISKMEERPFKVKARDNPRFKNLEQNAAEATSGSDTRFTKKYIAEMQRELDMLKAKRPGQRKRLNEASEMGDLSENAAYTHEKAENTKLNKRILELENLLGTAKELPEGRSPGKKIGLGDTVILEDNGKQKTYRILANKESDPVSGIISSSSPLGKGIMNKNIGESVTVNIAKKGQSEGKVKTYKIVSKK